MLRSFKQLAGEPDAPLRPLAANARDVLAWLQAAQVNQHPVLMKQGLGDCTAR